MKMGTVGGFKLVHKNKNKDARTSDSRLTKEPIGVGLRRSSFRG
jgi:hypothetical protein